MSTRLAIRAAATDELGAEQPPRGQVASDPDADGLRAGVVGLVVTVAGLAGGRGVAGGNRLVVAQAATCSNRIEHLDDLGQPSRSSA
jgi:hypothetical protein